MTMYIALNEDNKLVNIKQVERGLACQTTLYQTLKRRKELRHNPFMQRLFKCISSDLIVHSS